MTAFAGELDIFRRSVEYECDFSQMVCPAVRDAIQHQYVALFVLHQPDVWAAARLFQKSAVELLVRRAVDVVVKATLKVGGGDPRLAELVGRGGVLAGQCGVNVER